MTLSFNLLDEPWIPCLMLDGRFDTLNLRDTLLYAQEIREIHSDSPLTIAALHRLLLAITHRVFGPKNTRVWASLWQDGRGQWEAGRLNDYLEEYCRPRFDLFDKTHPFYQVAKFPKGINPALRPISDLARELTTGSNTMLFDHHSDQKPEAITPAEAACRIVTTQAYTLPGLSGISGQNFQQASWVRGAVFLIQGKNLFQTLLQNMREYPSQRSRLPDRPNDRPIWEMDDPFTPKRTKPLGYLDYLTWQSSRIKLSEPSVDGNDVWITHTYRTPGLGLDQDVLDPLKSYEIRGKEKSYEPHAFDTENVLWRDSVALFETNSDSTLPLETFEFLGRLAQDGVLEQHKKFNYLAFGLVKGESGAADIALWRQEHMPLPLRYLANPNTVTRLREALTLADDMERQLINARDWLAWLLLKPDEVRDLIDVLKQKDKDYLNRRKNEGFINIREKFKINRHYWWRLAVPFKHVMEDLVGDEAQADLARLAWAKELRQAAWYALEESIAGLDGSPRTLKAIVKARRELNRGLGRVLKIDNPEGGTNDS